jgi:hypothetical protein
MTTDTLKTWSHILFLLSIGLPVLGAGAAVGRYYIDRHINGPWTLSTREKETFLRSIKDAPKGKVAVEYIRSDEARSREFAVKIRDMLKDSGYEVWGYMAGFMQADAPPLVGARVSVKDQKSNVVGGGLQRAFQAVGIHAEGTQRAVQDATYDDDFVVVYIGMKP